MESLRHKATGNNMPDNQLVFSPPRLPNTHQQAYVRHPKSVVFLLLCCSTSPSGGFKVVYEYANRLVMDGHKVTIVYSIIAKSGRLSLRSWFAGIKRYLKYRWYGYSCRSWFNLSLKVNEELVMSLKQRNVPYADVYIATAVDTSYCLSDYKLKNSKRLYLIQGFENWGVSDDYVYASYKLGLTNIVISDWLAKKVEFTGEKCHIIKNGFDFDYFKLTNDIKNRNTHRIAMLYHNFKNKGCEYGIKAILRLKQKYPDLQVVLFGTPERPQSLPQWIEYYQKPDRETHNAIYNQSSIYLAPSLQEGWGLTVGEAMICGCAIVCTDTLGFKEMIKDGYNGLIVPAKDVDAIVDKINLLFSDDSLRIRLAKQGTESIKRFSWNDSYQKLQGLIDG